MNLSPTVPDFYSSADLADHGTRHVPFFTFYSGLLSDSGSVPWLVIFSFAFVNLWSAKRRKIRPSTGTEYSDDFSFEFARSSSAAPQRRFSSSVVLAGISLPATGTGCGAGFHESIV